MNNIKIYGLYAYQEGSHPSELSDEEFMSMAEEQGIVWSLKGFEDSFNSSNVSDTWYIRIINK